MRDDPPVDHVSTSNNKIPSTDASRQPQSMNTPAKHAKLETRKSLHSEWKLLPNIGASTPSTPRGRKQPGPQTLNPCRAKTMRSGRISHAAAPLGDSKLHHLVRYTSYSIFYVVVYAQASLCGADSSISAFISKIALLYSIK